MRKFIYCSSNIMRAPRIRVKFCKSQTLTINKDVQLQYRGCPVCRSVCVDERRQLCLETDRFTRSTSKWIKDINNNTIIIYEIYRCMPLLGDEKVHAPDWEEHIVRYQIVIVKDKQF